jgi:hypothetical protein
VKSLLLGLVLCASAHAASKMPALAGHWRGQLEVGNTWRTVDLQLDVSRDGKWIGSLLLGGVSGREYPVDEVVVDGLFVRCRTRLPQPTIFAGRVGTDGITLTGEADFGGRGKLRLERVGDPHVLQMPTSQLPADFVGDWQAEGEFRNTKFKLRLSLTRAPDGLALGTLAMINGENPIYGIVIDGTEVRFETFPINGNFQGRRNAQGEIEGTLKQGHTAGVTVTFKRVP